MELNFDFGPDTVNRKPAETVSPQIVQQTPFDQDERFSLVKAELSFVAIKDKLALMHKNAHAIDVKDVESNNTAMEMLVQCRAFIKSADKTKDNIPAYKIAAKFKSGVDTFIREQLRKPIEKIESLIKPKVGSYQKAQAELQRRIEQKNAEIERKRVEAENKKIKEAALKAHEKKVKKDEALQQKLNKEADKAGVERVQVDTPEFEEPEAVEPSAITPIVKQTEKVTTAQGTNVIKPRFVCIIIDPDKVPREYCQPNQKALDTAVEAGARSINGCKIEEKFEAKVRISSVKKSQMFGDDI